MRNPTGEPDIANKRWPQAIWVAPRESSRPKYIWDGGLIFLPFLACAQFGWYREKEKLVPKGCASLFFYKKLAKYTIRRKP